MKHFIVICDSEAGYGRRLAEYINHKEEVPYNALFAQSEKELRDMTHMSVDICVCDSTIRPVAESVLGDIRILELYSNTPVDRGSFKYKKADLIIRDIINALSEAGISQSSVRRRAMKVIGVWGPDEGYNQSVLAVGLGTHLARKGKTLYMNIQPYAVHPYSDLTPGSTDMAEDIKDLSDLYFAVSTGAENIALQIGAGVTVVNRLHILPTMKSMHDLRSISERDWLELIANIEAVTDYDYLVLDISAIIDGFTEILKRLDVVISPTATDIGMNRQKMFLKELDGQGNKHLKDMIICSDISRAIAGSKEAGSASKGIPLEIERLAEVLLSGLGE